jgi:hypothetical protein
VRDVLGRRPNRRRSHRRSRRAAPRGDPIKFWNGKLAGLIRALPREQEGAAREPRGYDTMIGIDGWPIDPRHLFYQYDNR